MDAVPVLIAILVAAGSGLAIWSSQAEPAAEPGEPKIASITAAQVRAFQAQADAACLCARQTGNAECWADFDRTLARYEHASADTMCEEGSVSQVCFPPFDGPEQEDGSGQEGTCILRERSYGACSAEEERTRQAAARSRQEQGCSD